MSEPESNPAPQAPLKELSGRIGKYDIVKPLGKGAMGIVYLAHDTILERDVALKVMVASIADDPELKTRFEREAKAVARMTHPNVVNVFDLGQHTDGSPYIAMELLKGQDLQKAMRTPPPMPLERKCNVIVQILAGLAHAHQAGIVHRDIKPANIFINHDGTVKIMDFGVARLTTASMTGTGNIVGTADYMSPEQVKGAKVDGRSDLFSVGCMLYELLAGRRPFHSDNLMAIFYKITHEEPNFDLIPEGAAYDALMPILKKALAKNLEDRYQSAYEFAGELKEYLKANAATGAESGLEGLVDVEPPPTHPPSGTGAGTSAAAGATIVTGDEPVGATMQPPTQGRAATVRGTAATVRGGAATSAEGATILQREGTVGRGAARPGTVPPRAAPAVARPAPAPPPPAKSPLVPIAIGLGVLVVAVAAFVVYKMRPPVVTPSPAPTTMAEATPTTVAPPPTMAPTAPPTVAPQPTFAEVLGKGAAEMKSAQAAFKQGDYDRALLQAQKALAEEPTNAPARQMVENAQNGQKAMTHFRASEAAIASGDLDKATTEADAGRALAPWDPRAQQIGGRIQQAQQQAAARAEQQKRGQVAQQVNTFLSQADGALGAAKYDQAIALYDEALKLDGGNQRALNGKSSAVQARALSQAAAAGGGTRPATGGRSFASGKTVAQSIETKAGGSVPEGFEDSPGVAVKKGSTAAELPGKINFDIEPESPKPGDRYTVRIYLVNEGSAPISVKDMIVTSTRNGRKVSAPVPPQTRDVAPQQKALLLNIPDTWKEDTASWSMEVTVGTVRGERYTNQLTWK